MLIDGGTIGVIRFNIPSNNHGLFLDKQGFNQNYLSQQNINNFPYNINVPQQQEEWVSPPMTPGEAAPMDPNTPYKGYISNIPEAKESLVNLQEKVQSEYAVTYQEAQQLLDELEGDPEAGVSSEMVQEMKRQIQSPADWGETIKSTTNVSDWIKSAVDLLLDPKLYFVQDVDAYISAITSANQQLSQNNVILQELINEGRRHNSAVSDILDKWYDPTAGNTGQYKTITKALMVEGKTHGQVVGNLMVQDYITIPDLNDYPITASEKFKSIFGVDPKVVADTAKSGKLKAFANAVDKMTKIQKIGVGVGIGAVVVDGILDGQKYREELGNALTADGWDLVAKAKHFKENVGQEAWDAINIDAIDALTTGIGIGVGVVLTPAAGLAVGGILHVVGAGLKAGYYKS